MVLFAAKFEARLFENQCVVRLPESLTLKGLRRERTFGETSDDASFLILFLTTPNPSVPLSRPFPEEEMKGPPVLVVGETQLP